MTSLVRRVLLAAECDGRSELRATLYAGPASSCAALGSFVDHVIRTLARDRKLLTAWLETPPAAKP